jgi:hypothetical protein
VGKKEKNAREEEGGRKGREQTGHFPLTSGMVGKYHIFVSP